VRGFAGPTDLFAYILQACRAYDEAAALGPPPLPATLYYLNIHTANQAWRYPQLKRIYQQASVVYADGAGIVLGSHWASSGPPLPCRLTMADWIFDLLAELARHGRRVYFLGGDPGLPEALWPVLEQRVPQHTVVGAHHGYLQGQPALGRQVISDINALAPDVLLVGMGTPTQEFWMEAHRNQLRVKVLYATGAVMDYHTGRQPRCPQWMGTTGLEWLHRLGSNPRRLFGRYVLGNPWFMARIGCARLLPKLGTAQES
jgi:N-acetylglucosaminyldiphosphoundecaprenol N-acetyl-beta-D-mannosaminyltransferase